MQTATLGSVPCPPCDIGTVLSRQPIACQARRVRGWTKLRAKFRELGQRHRSRCGAIRIAVASIKMSVSGFDDALKLGEHLALTAKRRSRPCDRVVRSQLRLSAPRHRSVKPGPAGHRRWRLAGLTDRRREAARSAHAINAGMSMTAPMTLPSPAPRSAPESPIPRDHPGRSRHPTSLRPKPAPLRRRSLTFLENPPPSSTVGAHSNAGKKVRISTGVHTRRRKLAGLILKSLPQDTGKRSEPTSPRKLSR